MENKTTEVNENAETQPDHIYGTENALPCFCAEDTAAEDSCPGVPFSVRLRSWPVWLAVLGSVGVILNSFGFFAKWGLDTDTWNTVINAAGGIFIAFGVVNNPTDRKHF